MKKNISKAVRGTCSLCGRTDLTLQKGICSREANWMVRYGYTKEQCLDILTSPEYTGIRGKNGLLFKNKIKGLENIKIEEEKQPEIKSPVKGNEMNSGAKLSDFPRCKMTPMWFTSDGREFGNELDALRHQIEIHNDKLKKRGEDKI